MNLTAEEFLSLSQAFLGQGYRLRFQASGTSMSPTILNGAILDVEPLSGTEVRVGEVAFYRNPRGRMVAHRVIEKQNRHLFITKGDAHYCTTEEVNANQILGRVVSVEWRPGLTFHIDSGLGRRLGLFLAWASFLLIRVDLSLQRINERHPRWFQWLPRVRRREEPLSAVNPRRPDQPWLTTMAGKTKAFGKGPM